MLKHLETFLTRKYKPLNLIEISQKNLLANYHYLESCGIKIAPVLKSNAYGHGLVEVAKILDRLSIPFFCVDSLFEAYELLKSGIKSKILVMGYVDPESLRTKKLPFSFTLYTMEQIKVFSEYQPQCPLHIFVDSGMHREGFQAEMVQKVIKESQRNGLKIEGIMSHFAEAENPSKRETKKQIANFKNILNTLEHMNVLPRFVHFSNTSATLHLKELEGVGNVARCGLGLYGIDPEGKNRKLLPALQFKSKVAQLKEIPKGDFLGYGFTYKAPSKRKIAVLPLGYNDGLDRRLSNKGFVYVAKIPCPIVGRISMNITTIDVTRCKNIKVGDEVTIFSSKAVNKNSIYNAATIANTIPYDLLVHLHTSTRRVVR